MINKIIITIKLKSKESVILWITIVKAVIIKNAGIIE